MVFKIFIIIFSIQLNSLCFADYRDPTKPAFYSTNKKTVYNQVDDLNLSSIWISNRSRRVTINGVTAKQGEMIFSNIKIVSILKGSVLIEQKGLRRKLYLLKHPFKTR